MWSVGVYDLGLRSDDVWKLTFAQFYALSQRKDINRTMDDLGFGIVASTVANVHRDSKRRAKPYEPKDFIPDYSGKNQRKVRLKPEALKRKWEQEVLPSFRVIDKRKKPDDESNSGIIHRA